MKVFRVISEYVKENSKDLVSQQQFVTHKEDSLLAVVEFMTAECEQLEHDLKSVEEVLVVCQQIGY